MVVVQTDVVFIFHGGYIVTLRLLILSTFLDDLLLHSLEDWQWIERGEVCLTASLSQRPDAPAGRTQIAGFDEVQTGRLTWL